VSQRAQKSALKLPGNKVKKQTGGLHETSTRQP
jgi:hypothetical protein